mgnify:CR=1 FL=1
MKKDKDYNGTRTFIASISGNFVSEDTYNLGDFWYNLTRWNIWDFFPFNRLADEYYNRMKQRGLGLKARSIVMRDRAERTMFYGGEE